MNSFYMQIREKLLSAYQSYIRKDSFDEFLFKNHLFYLLPDSYTAKVKAMVFFNKEMKKQQEKYIELLNNFAEEKKIKIVHIKGIILANLLYENPELRFSGDIDLYAEKKARYIIEDFLIREGFKKEVDGTEFHSTFSRMSENNKIVIEIHNELYVSSAEAFSRIKSVPLSGIKTRTVHYQNHNIYALDYTYEFLYLFIHLLRHFIDGTIHPVVYLLSNYPVARIVELVLYVDKFRERIDWEYIKSYLNKLQCGTLINQFFSLIHIFIPLFDVKIDNYDSKAIFRSETFFELYKGLNYLDPFDYIFCNANQLWTKNVLKNNSKNLKIIFPWKRYNLKVQMPKYYRIDFKNYTVNIKPVDNQIWFSFYFPKNELFAQRKEFLWESDTVELILFNLEQNDESFYHRFFINRNKHDFDIHEDDYRKYTEGKFYNEVKVAEGITAIFQAFENENCISVNVKLDVFKIDIHNLFFDFVVNLNKSNELVKLSLNEENPDMYLLPFNYSILST